MVVYGDNNDRRRAQKKDLDILTALALKLWPGHEAWELRRDLEGIMDGGGAFFLAREGEYTVGFAQCQLRHDYVEGTENSPVGYLEGIYVEPSFRGRGIARQLLSAAENWAREQGCNEFASDCELDNRESLAFHLGLGFREANRIICFVKEL